MTENSAAKIASIFRYPVKGLSPEPLPQTTLTPGQPLPGDRRYAIENGPSGFDPAAPKTLPKIKYLMLMRDERLAAIHTHFDDADNILTIRDNGTTIAGNLDTTDGRAAIEAYFAARFAAELRGQPRVLQADGFSFSDVAAKVVSIINLASVAALEEKIGQPVHPLRFRANLYVTGWPAWREFDLLGKTLAIGDTRLKIVRRIVRCAATDVNPDTAARDLEIPKTLMREFGHADCGVYAEVVSGGAISAGDRIVVQD